MHLQKKKVEIIYRATDSDISYTGRWIENLDGSKVSYYGGAYAEAQFTGEKAVVMLGDDVQQVHIFIDGNETFISGASGNLDLSAKIDKNAEIHTIRVVSRYYNDNITLKG